jgi:hypothetical protein
MLVQQAAVLALVGQGGRRQGQEQRQHEQV